MFRALALTLALSPLAAVHALDFESRGNQICSGAECFARLPVGPGLDLRAQMDRFHQNFTDKLELKTPDAQLTFRMLLDVGGAMALDEAARTELERGFKALKLTDLGIRLSQPPAAPDQKPTGQTTPVEIPFVASLAWADASGATGTTKLRGHLAVPNDFQIDAGKPPAELNVLLSPLITVDDITGGGPTAVQIKNIVGPAVMGNLILAMLSPLDELKGSELEAMGRALQGHPTAGF